jgi:hypothetical protein
VTPVWLDTVVVKPDDVDISTLYDVAPETAPQFMVSEVSWFVAPFDGDTRDGGAGIAVVVKLHTLDHIPVPPAFVAFTFQ